MPTEVSYFISNDGANFEKLTTIYNLIDPKEYNTTIHNFWHKNINKKAKYVKVIAKNFGKLPDWHQGFPFGGEAFIFIDEIVVR